MSKPLSQLSQLGKSVAHAVTESAGKAIAFVSGIQTSAVPSERFKFRLATPKLPQKLDSECLYSHYFERQNLRFCIQRPKVQD